MLIDWGESCVKNCIGRASAKFCLVGAAVLLAGCSSTPVAEAPKPAAPLPTLQPPVNSQASQTSGTGSVPSSTVKTVSLPAHLDPQSQIAKGRSVFFDYDAFTIKPEFIGVVERHGKYLVSNPRLAIRIEGNADERGSSEYNLALGQKRAEAVLKSLAILGVGIAQMEAISWGKEKPRAPGHDEAAWAQNRRVDLQYPSR